MRQRGDFVLTLYKTLMRASTPFLELYLKRRERRGKEDAARAHERRGRPRRARGKKPLVWCHAASVGESVSLLSLVTRLLRDRPDIEVMMTTGTVTSARLMAERLPQGAFHQYVPVDHPSWVADFLRYWKPDLAVWSESELWPNLLMRAQETGIPAVLLNARMSEETFRRWRKFPKTSRRLLSAFRLCLAQNAAEAARLEALGARDVRVAGNLKYAALPLPYDEGRLAELRRAAGRRPLLLWASTHPGEEEIAARLHARLARDVKGLLTIIVPRHPQRGESVRNMLAAQGLKTALRAHGEALKDETDIYIADTLGELGLFYRLCRNVVMGGTFADVGGHNPIEPAQCGCVIFCGPQMYNFKGICADFDAKNALVHAADEEALYAHVLRALQEPASFDAVALAARDWTDEKSYILDELSEVLRPLLPPVAAPARENAS